MLCLIITTEQLVAKMMIDGRGLGDKASQWRRMGKCIPTQRVESCNKEDRASNLFFSRAAIADSLE